jgi:crotonobetainyl-CoA:carnitine CoA-transferase CaiB-like acyl-CoA transferase
MARPFEGIRILDFSQVVSGPFATSLLTLMGAEVIKFERPPGDESRTFCASPELLAKGAGSAFIALNCGKRSVSLDLKHPKAIEAVRRLVRNADVIVENYRPGVMARLGLGYAALKEVRPDLIYCSISGYGQRGPEVGSPAYDGAIQAACGIMSITGAPEGGPMRVGFPFSDAATGSSAALAIAGALFRRQRDGKGQYIDIAMVDASLSMMTQIVAFTSVAGVVPGQIGNMAWSRRPTSDLFRASDGSLMFVVNSEPQYALLLRTIGRPDVLEDPRFATWELRSRNITALRAVIEEALSTDTVANWEQRLKAAGVAAAQVKTIGEALASPQIAHRNLLLTVPGPAGVDRPVTVMNAPFLCDEDGPGTDRPAPAVGEHNAEVLSEAGYTPEEVACFEAEGVFWRPPQRVERTA